MRLILLIVTVSTIRLALALVRFALRRPRLSRIGLRASVPLIELARSLQDRANQTA